MTGYVCVQQFESQLTGILIDAQLEVTPDLTRDEAGAVVEGLMFDLSFDDAMAMLAEAATTRSIDRAV